MELIILKSKKEKNVNYIFGSKKIEKTKEFEKAVRKALKKQEV